MGEFSRQLIPDLIGAMRRGVYFPTSPLVSIIARLKATSCYMLRLNSMRASDHSTLSIAVRCWLLVFCNFRTHSWKNCFKFLRMMLSPGDLQLWKCKYP